MDNVIMALRIAGMEENAQEKAVNALRRAGLNVARQMAMDAGVPKEVPAFTLNKVCGSGLRAVSLAAQMIKAGDAEIIVAGGAESITAFQRTEAEAGDCESGCRIGTDHSGG